MHNASDGKGSHLLVRVPRPSIAQAWGVVVCMTLVWLSSTLAHATIVTTFTGMKIEGALGSLPSIQEDPMVANVGPAAGVNLIVLVDDGLRRTYLPKSLVDFNAESDRIGVERIRIRQRVANGRRQVSSVTAIRNVSPFDNYGRRVYSILTPRGAVDVFQGITEITPLYTKVEGLVGKPSIAWDCRVATSSIPRETLSQVLRRQGVRQGVDARLSIVRLFFDAERYRDAQIELEEAMRDFPELADSEKMRALVVELKQYTAKRLVDEIERRQDAGQHTRVRTLLAAFPSQGVASETLQRVSELLRRYRADDNAIGQLKERIGGLVDSLPDTTIKPQVEPIRAEIDADLSLNTIDRLGDFQRLDDDQKLTDDMRLSLAISGWILGTGAATQNLSEAISVIRARELVIRYLRSRTDAERAEILSLLGREEAGTPTRVLQIVQQLTPPFESSPHAGRPPGNFLLRATVGGAEYDYEVQLPDEYDPYRRYPTIVTLHSLGRSPSDQVDWWAGAYDENRQARAGQATRNGYIVIAPKWLPSGKRSYEYSGREHAAVLSSLRDACRRFSVDTDRVYLSGHSIGGDAAWDIGLAHPDLWAGVIPIVAVGDYGPKAPKYIAQYWPNAVQVPFYFVMGELDGDKLELNRRDFDRYLKRGGKNAIDVTITEYIGRGHEHFYEEIHRIFEWMELHRRDFNQAEYEFVTMRNFDNYCFNLELSGLPSRSVVGPYQWPTKSAGPSEHEFSRKEDGSLRVKTGAETARLWLTPDTLDADGRVTVSVNGRSRKYPAVPTTKTVLEDSRTRADRKHPFWIEIELVTGNRAQ